VKRPDVRLRNGQDDTTVLVVTTAMFAVGF
jgi:hypothetical protein